MKLISLYIENFGGLSRYSLEFSEGVTVIAEPNGFGKTTLAEFIRAMFYGFPRKAKTLDKSRRQKYTPWNGGKCGGNLVFEHENRRYRIERTFGATPKSDTFKVIDLATNKKTDRFPEEIGLELFQLDADSFERSTYMPQLSGSGSLSTNNIQAKLTRLVEDTGDINHFDKAMETLRSKRSTFVPYRGNGGTVAEARSRISGLQQELDRAGDSRDRLQECQMQIVGLEEECGKCDEAIASVRRDITAASEAAAAAALRREYGQLMAGKQADQEVLDRLSRAYPNGIPAPERIGEAEGLVRQLAVLEGRQVTTASDLAARDYAKQNRQRFGGRVPDGPQLEQRRRQHRALEALLTEARSIGLSEQEQLQYEEFLPLAEAGKLDARRLEQLSADNRELEKLKSALEHTAMDPAEQQKLAQLERYFSAGVPEKRQLEALREELKATQQLRQETAQLAASIPAPQHRKSVSPVPMILALLLGIGAVTAGIVLLIQSLYLAGGLVLGIGVIGLIAGVFLGLRMMLSRELSGGSAAPELLARIDGNRIRIRQLEEKIAGFTGRYSTQTDPAEALREIEDRAEDYGALRRRRESIDEKRKMLSSSALTLERKLVQELSCTPENLGRAIMELHVSKEQFSDLQAEKKAADIRRRELLEQAEALRRDLTGYLAVYFENVQPEQFGTLLSRLQRESEEYVRCCDQLRNWQDRCREHREELEVCNAGLDRFFREYALTREDDLPRQLQQLRSDGETVTRINRADAQRNERLEELIREKGSILTEPQPEQTWDTEDLKLQERQLSSRQTELTRQLLQAKQDRIRLREEADRIPGLRDELSAWSARKKEDQQKAELLDETMAFLEKAKDHLSGSYLGPVREHFARYLNRLSGGNSGEILISPELEVQLERQGQARELAFFSAGQTDLVLLCMRLALVDALFGEEKPFVILDDPFVNLDDERTAQALQLLQELGKERQILYLVCNSSRKL